MLPPNNPVLPIGWAMGHVCQPNYQAWHCPEVCLPRVIFVIMYVANIFTLHSFLLPPPCLPYLPFPADRAAVVPLPKERNPLAPCSTHANARRSAYEIAYYDVALATVLIAYADMRARWWFVWGGIDGITTRHPANELDLDAQVARVGTGASCCRSCCTCRHESHVLAGILAGIGSVAWTAAKDI